VPIVSLLASIAGILSAAWTVFGILLRRAVGRIEVLRTALGVADGPAGAEAVARAVSPLPSLSVVVAARDEVLEIETTVRRLLEQRYPGLEVIVVDDRSADGTGEILDRLLARAGGERLAVIHNRVLPRGWLGKCHACRLGAERARGEWILFLDGDVELVADDLLARVVALASGRGYDHVAVIPDQRPVSPLQQALLSVFAQMYLLAARVYEMDRDKRRGGAGIGAFNLVRRSSYDRIGGHVLLRMDPADDYKLGRLLKESGARQRLFDGVDLVRCPWHRGALNVARGLEKNLFAGFDYSVLELAGFSILALALVFGPAAVALASTVLPTAAGAPGLAAFGCLPLALEVAFIGSGFRLQSRRFGGSALLLSLVYPVAVLILIGAAWNSAIRTIARGGIRWRDTFYGLRELRAGRVRAGAGRRLGML
jgi:glycosyltransferase involved in cell wall biosynthesis